MGFVQFFSGKKLPESINQDGLYFIKNDYGKLYRGAELISETNEVTAAEMASALEKIQTLEGEIFVGTYAEYQEAYEAGQIPEGAVVHITDDDSSSNSGGSSGGGGGSSIGGAISVVTTLPLASASYRGKYLILEKENIDYLYVCMKKSGSYQWFEISTDTTGLPGEETTSKTTAVLGVAVLGNMKLGEK